MKPIHGLFIVLAVTLILYGMLMLSGCQTLRKQDKRPAKQHGQLV